MDSTSGHVGRAYGPPAIRAGIVPPPLLGSGEPPQTIISVASPHCRVKDSDTRYVGVLVDVHSSIIRSDGPILFVACSWRWRVISFGIRCWAVPSGPPTFLVMGGEIVTERSAAPASPDTRRSRKDHVRARKSLARHFGQSTVLCHTFHLRLQLLGCDRLLPLLLERLQLRG